MKFLGNDDEVIIKCIITGEETGEAVSLNKTAEWFKEHEKLPRIGDTVIAVEYGPANKPFYEVHSVVWDTTVNEVLILLELKVKKMAYTL